MHRLAPLHRCMFTLRIPGVNVRYMGNLARLCLSAISESLLPSAVLDVIELEMVARAVRSIVRDYLQRVPELRTCPAPLLARVLSCLLGPAKGHSVAAEASSGAGGPPGGPGAGGPVGQGKKKAGSKKARGGAVSGLPMYCGGGEGFADVPSLASKALKALKLTHESLWVRADALHWSPLIPT
jgi:hypothetical protein